MPDLDEQLRSYGEAFERHAINGRTEPELVLTQPRRSGRRIAVAIAAAAAVVGGTVAVVGLGAHRHQQGAMALAAELRVARRLVDGAAGRTRCQVRP